jgi:hypothetical protein
MVVTSFHMGVRIRVFQKLKTHIVKIPLIENLIIENLIIKHLVKERPSIDPGNLVIENQTEIINSIIKEDFVSISKMILQNLLCLARYVSCI